MRAPHVAGIVTALLVGLLAPTAAASAPGTDRDYWTFQRLTHRSDTVCSWTEDEAMKLVDGGGRPVFLQYRDGHRGNAWQPWIRQTTRPSGRFDFSAKGRQARRLKTRHYRVDEGRRPGYSTRLYAPGDATHQASAWYECRISYH